QSLPILDCIIDSFYKRDAVAEDSYPIHLLRRADELDSSIGGAGVSNGTAGGAGAGAGGNSTSAGGLNSTNGTAGAGSSGSASSEGGEPSVLIYGFSQNFTELYNEEVTFGQSDVSALLSNSSNSNSTSSSPDSGSDGESSPSLEEVLESKFTNVTLEYELLNSTDSSNFSSANLIEIYQGINEESETHNAFIVAPPTSDVDTTAFFLEAVLPENVTSKVYVISDVNSRNVLSGGYKDLYDAVLLASSNSTPEDLNILVVENSYIHSGLHRIDQLGYINGDEAEWYYENIKPLNLSSGLDDSSLPEDFAKADVETLPSVITLDLTNDNLALVGSLSQLDVKGLVLSTSSLDSYSESLEKSLSDVQVPVVIASDSPSVRSGDVPEDAIFAGILDATRAKILLQVGLAAGYDKDKLKQLFSSAYGG
ncbi:hypothetical protein WICPIJ_005790, partial [Wickerhamomyces pijperi]